MLKHNRSIEDMVQEVLDNIPEEPFDQEEMPEPEDCTDCPIWGICPERPRMELLRALWLLTHKDDKKGE